MLCHNYIFFDSDPSIHTVSPAELKKQKTQFAEIIARHKNVKTEAYATLGLKAGTRFGLWMQADSVEEIQTILAELMHTPLGAHLKITYTLFGLIRESQYSKKPPEETKATERRYLIVYPFTKTKEWHLIAFDERKNMMWDHVKVGKKFSASIEQVLLYAYGVDDDATRKTIRRYSRVSANRSRTRSR